MPEIAVLYRVGEQAELLGGFTVSVDSVVDLSVSVQRLASASPPVWVAHQDFPTVVGVFAAAGVEKTFTDARGTPYIFDAVQPGVYRWVAFIDAVGATETFFSEFQVVADEAGAGVLRVVTASLTSVTLNYTPGANFGHGTLVVIDPSGAQVQSIPISAGGNVVVSDLQSGTRYLFYVNTFNVDGFAGSDSNAVYATTLLGPLPTVQGVQPFFEIYVNNNPKGDSIVYWGLKRTFCDPGPYRFMLQWAETVKGEWEDVLASPVSDTYWAVDPKPRLFAVQLESFYRVILITAKNTYVSFAVQATGVWSKRDWLVARDILRRETLVHKKFAGWRGWLLKRKIWGPVCPECGDFDTQETGKGHCKTCFGTGKVGGYWPGYEVYAYQLPNVGPQAHKQQHDQYAMLDNEVLPSMRMNAYPHIATYDIFVDQSSGRRFVVRPVSLLAEIKGIPLIYSAEFRLASFTDIVYNVPIEPPAPPPYVEETPAPVLIDTDEFLEFPEKPPEVPIEVVVPEPTPPEPEPASPEIEIEAAPLNAIWAEGPVWYVGQTIGQEGSAWYRTNNGIPNPYLLPDFAWDTVMAGAGTTITITRIANGFTVVSTQSGLSGTYLQAGTYEGMFVYLQQ